MPRPRYYKLPVERRMAILIAAAKELSRCGYDGTSLNRILEQAGLSKGAAYYYFDSKEDLLATVFLELWERLVVSPEFDLDELTAATYWDKIFVLATQFFESARDEPWIISAAKAMWGLPIAVRTAGPLGEAFNTVVQWLASLIRRGQTLGTVRDDLPEGLLLAVVVAMDLAADRWIVEHWEALEESELGRYSTLMLDMFRRVLAPADRGTDGQLG